MRARCKSEEPLSSGLEEREQAIGKLVEIDRLFNGCHFDRDVIILCVRYYLHYELRFRDPVEIMTERGLSPALTTLKRWVKRLGQSVRTGAPCR